MSYDRQISSFEPQFSRHDVQGGEVGFEGVVAAAPVERASEPEEVRDDELRVVGEPVVLGAEVVPARGEPVQQDHGAVAAAGRAHRQLTGDAAYAVAGPPATDGAELR